jgi:hypothetical protein
MCTVLLLLVVVVVVVGSTTVICNNPTVMGQYGPDKVPVLREGNTIDAHYCLVIADYCARRPHYSSQGV